jgi:hypothetical protein
MRTGPKELHQDFFGHRVLAMCDQVLENGLAFAAGPLSDRLVVLEHPKWTQAVDDQRRCAWLCLSFSLNRGNNRFCLHMLGCRGRDSQARHVLCGAWNGSLNACDHCLGAANKRLNNLQVRLIRRGTLRLLCSCRRRRISGLNGSQNGLSDLPGRWKFGSSAGFHGCLDLGRGRRDSRVLVFTSVGLLALLGR